MIPFVDLKAQYLSLKPEIDSAIARVLNSGQFVGGKELLDFENNFAKFCGVKYAIGVSSGTAALQIALAACGIRAGDEVITTPFTFVATVEAILKVGAKPVFVDINPLTCNIDPNEIESVISSKTRAILPVHLYGQSVEMDQILDLAARYNLFVIEDAAQAHGAMYQNHKVGSIGNVGCFSFYPSKNLGAYGDGGIITTNDVAIAQKATSLRDHGSTTKYIHTEIGSTDRLDSLQAAILNVKLPYLERWTKERQLRAHFYDNALAQAQIFRNMSASKDDQHVYHLYVLQIPNRDIIVREMQEQEIQVGVHYPIPVHLQLGYKFLGYKTGDFARAERAAQSVLSLPFYPELTFENIQTVVETLKPLLLRANAL